MSKDDKKNSETRAVNKKAVLLTKWMLTCVNMLTKSQEVSPLKNHFNLII